MIFLFTDFGRDGPYVGQVHAVLARAAPGAPVIDLIHDLPAYDSRAAAYLLPAYTSQAEPGDVILAVVDPGVGTARAPVALHADGRWYVGPDNGLFAMVARRATACEQFDITWRPPHLSRTFHGRDLFAPVAAALAREGFAAAAALATPVARSLDRTDWPDDLPAIVYTDRYGNALTGMRAGCIPRSARIDVSGWSLSQAETYATAPPGAPFWYENANGLVEIAVDRGSAAALLDLRPGTALVVDRGGDRADR